MLSPEERRRATASSLRRYPTGYVGFDHPPYLSFWIAIDDATASNGCLSVLPRNLDTEDDIEPHRWDDGNRERVGYDGNDPGHVVECPAGTIVAFSSRTLHRSGPNTTDHARRAYLAQYSIGPIHDPETGQVKNLARPLAEVG